MKKKVTMSNLKLEKGKFTGGFAPLNEFQIEKIKGGRKRIEDGNDKCHNVQLCSGVDNTGCTNDLYCG